MQAEGEINSASGQYTEIEEHAGSPESHWFNPWAGRVNMTPGGESSTCTSLIIAAEVPFNEAVQLLQQSSAAVDRGQLWLDWAASRCDCGGGCFWKKVFMNRALIPVQDRNTTESESSEQCLN